jgi:N-acetylglutamate synthase-like GNAT family acetyltransferase
MWASSPTPEGFRDVIGNTEFFVSERDGQIVGFGFLDKRTERIEAIFVDPDVQRSGLGSAILQTLEDTARKAGLASLTLSSTLNAVAFYEHAGFKALKRTRYEHPNGFELDCVIMQKELRRS